MTKINALDLNLLDDSETVARFQELFLILV
jgi:hypothetical protein